MIAIVKHHHFPTPGIETIGPFITEEEAQSWAQEWLAGPSGEAEAALWDVIHGGPAWTVEKINFQPDYTPNETEAYLKARL